MWRLASREALAGFAAEKQDEKAKPYPLDKCIVTDEKLGEMGKPFVFTHEGQEIKLCCKSCQKDFKKDTAKYIKKIEAEGKSAKEIGAILEISARTVEAHKYRMMDEIGVKRLFWKVAQKPGKPLTFGMLAGRPWFGLPGNPVSSLVCFYVYARPALRKMMGFPAIHLPTVEATVGAETSTAESLTEFIRCLAPELSVMSVCQPTVPVLAAVSLMAARGEPQPASMVMMGGPIDARIALVGEQPGDQEDLQGAPFVGPAGEVLDRSLREAGLERERLYVTNAVKHFKFVPRGKRRIHQTPTLADVAGCRPWVEAELALVRPEVLVCLGATAARAFLGPDVRLMKEHGRIVPTRWAPKTLATLHPSAVLRGEDEPAQERLYAMLVADLTLAARAASA